MDHSQIVKLEAFQKQCLKPVFPNIDGYDPQLEARNIWRLKTYLSGLFDVYAQKVTSDPDRRLANLCSLNANRKMDTSHSSPPAALIPW